MKVIFVGDAILLKNTNLTITFDGTKPGATLSKWANQLEVEYTAVNSRDPIILNTMLRFAAVAGVPVIALGRLAKARIERSGIKVALHTLPHPSLRNKALNNKENVSKLLSQLKETLNDKV